MGLEKMKEIPQVRVHVLINALVFRSTFGAVNILFGNISLLFWPVIELVIMRNLYPASSSLLATN